MQEDETNDNNENTDDQVTPTEAPKETAEKKATPAKPATKKKAATTPKSKTGKGKTTSKTAASTPRRVARIFPAITLEEALRIPVAIKTINGGNPWTPDQVGGAVGLKSNRVDFFYLAAGSVAYGLTVGGWKAEKIELSTLGRDLLYAPNPQVEHAKKLEAFLTIDVFKKVLEYYKGSELPEMKYLGNTLERDFALPPEQHEDFSKIFKANCDFLKIQSGFQSVTNNGAGTSFDNNGSAVAIPSSITLAEPERDTKQIAFVIMPFVERDTNHEQGFFTEVLRSLITPAARDAGFIVRTANRHGSDVIQSTIINDLLAADLVIADLTEHNPNVLFELGVRMANDLPICLIKASETGPVFDIDNMLRVYTYSKNLWATTIEKDLPNLTAHIKGAWDGRGSDSTYMKILKRGVVATSPNSFDAFPVTIRG